MDTMLGKLGHHWPVATRREFFTRAGSGLAGLALAQVMAEDRLLSATPSRDPLDPKPTHFKPTAKSVIWLFMEGGPSTIDLFDYKPKLAELEGQPLPDSLRPKQTAMGTAYNGLMASKRTFKQHGQSGLWVSDWYPNIAEHVDDLSVIRSCWADGINHVGSVCQMNTGSILQGRPSMGSWVNYGLGSANKNLPSFVVFIDEKQVSGGAKNWSSGFLPATYQGTQFRQGSTPLLDLKPPTGGTDAEQRGKLEILRRLNQLWSKDKEEDTELDARTRSYELAYQMQSTAPEAVDLSKESDATKTLYGMDDPATAGFGKNCLLARRLVERGVRFVELYCGAWDAHTDLEGNHSKNCRESDKPVAGLITDLKARGMLEDTLVVWGGEFGRTPFSEQTKGRDHNPWGFAIFMAGGGVKGGQYIGTTDELGLRAQEQPVHVHDIHASILHALGLNHIQLTYMHNGRAERPTIVGGQLIQGLFA